MELFDQLESIGMRTNILGVVKGGYIAKMFSDYYEDIEICDRLR